MEVITSVQGRRRWSVAEKIRLVEEAQQPDMSVSYSTRRAGITPPPSFLPGSVACSKAVYHRGGLVHHSDRGSQYISIRYAERLAEAGIEPTVGSVGDSYNNALAGTINGLYKADLIHRRGQSVFSKPSSSQR